MWVGEASQERSRSDIADAADAIHRHGVGLCLWIALCLGSATGLLVQAKPQFVAATQVVLEPRATADDGPDIARMFQQLKIDDAQAQTQMHLILSEGLLRYVFNTLDLSDAPELSANSGSDLGPFSRWVGSGRDADEPRMERERAFSQFKDRVRARRIGLTYVIEISSWAHDPVEAVRISNAVAAAYVRDRIRMAATDASAGGVPVKRRIDRILTEAALATSAVKLGAVPDAHFPDAGVRLLGAALPTGKAFPRPRPFLAVALCFGAVSGLLGTAILRQADRKIRSRRRLRELFGIDCLSCIPLARLPVAGRRVRRPVEADWDQGLQAVRAALAANGLIGSHRRIGILGSIDRAGPRKVALGLSNLLSASRLPAVLIDMTGLVAEPIASADASDRFGVADLAALRMTGEAGLMTIFALPPLGQSAEARAILPSLDAAILIVEADRASVAEVDAALAALRAAKTSLAGILLAGHSHGSCQI